MIDGPEVILTYQLQAPDARSALESAQNQTRDLMLVLGASFAAYEFVIDERQYTKRTDAVYQAEGPLPPLDVAEGMVTAEGVDWIDPTGEHRRSGRVLSLRAQARVKRPVVADAKRWDGREAWNERLRRALALFHAGQSTGDEQVRFSLSLAALEVLAEPQGKELLGLRLDTVRRDELLHRVAAAVKDDNLTSNDQQRLVSRLRDTQETGLTAALSRYLESRGVSVTSADVRAWQKERGAYLHNGFVADRSEQRYHLIHAVSLCLQRELDLAYQRRSSRG